jgi:manganese efflux pump family protein
MSILETLLLAVALAMDASAVSLGMGSGGYAGSRRPVFRVSFHFGLFQALMTLLGWAAGSGLERLISSVDHWVAVILLAFVALRMIASGLDPRAETQWVDPTRGMTLILLSVATSIDAAAAGLSLAVLDYPILFPVLSIGLVTAVFSLAGLTAGQRLGAAFGKRMEIAGGLVLLLIGARILITHL